MVRGLRRWMAKLMVILGEITLIVKDGYAGSYYQEKSQHAADELRCDGWKTDGNGNAEGRVEQQKILARSRRAMVRGL